jgi:hypothetical protein
VHHLRPSPRSLRRIALLSALALGAVGLGVAALPGSSPAARVRAAKHQRQAARVRPAKHQGRASQHPLKMIWGPVLLPNGKSAFPTYHKLGVQVFEIDLDWATTSPTRPANPQDPNDPAYQWPAQLDYAVQQAARYGIKICLLVKASPGWANGNRSVVWAPNDPADYANFLIAAAHHYSSVRDWMVWGEPNRDQQPDFEPMPVNSPVGPRRYAVILKAGYDALKSVSRSNIVIGGDTWSFGLVEPADFVKWMRLPNGQPPPLDYYGHNPFGRRFPDLKEKPYFPGGRDINDIDTLEAQLARTYHRRVMLWLSEFTISSVHSNYAFNFHTSLAGQARWLTAAFRIADSVDYVAGMGWFNLLDSPLTGPVNRQLTSGLLTWAMKRKPSYYAYLHAR